MPKQVAKPKLMTESQFQKEILTAFKNDANIKIFRRNVGGMPSQSGGYVQFGDKGMSDLWGWVVEHRCPRCNRLQEGTHFEIELKSVEGKLTVEQKNCWASVLALKQS